MRTLLLWLARNAWLRERIPRLGPAKRAVQRFMPGEDMSAALDAAARFQVEGMGTLFTLLGENVERMDEAEAVAAQYQELLDGLAGRGIAGELSVKLTQLGLDVDMDQAATLTGRLAERAAQMQGVLWIDMEGSAYTERTVAFYERLKQQGHDNLGLCLQAYLRRTPADIRRLLPLSPAIRLVKGAYDEPGSIAYRGRRAVDANYAACARALLDEQARGSGLRIGFGTHDVSLVEQIASHADALGLPKDAFEIQMLYGIRTGQLRRLARDGYPVRSLIAYGPAWYPWYMRRLAERPANVLFALRQLVG